MGTTRSDIGESNELSPRNVDGLVVHHNVKGIFSMIQL